MQMLCHTFQGRFTPDYLRRPYCGFKKLLACPPAGPSPVDRAPVRRTTTIDLMWSILSRWALTSRRQIWCKFMHQFLSYRQLNRWRHRADSVCSASNSSSVCVYETNWIVSRMVVWRCVYSFHAWGVTLYTLRCECETYTFGRTHNIECRPY